ncbi:unnamed protein product [Alternaria alternata]
MAATNHVGEHGDVVQVEPMGEDETLALLHTRVPFGESSRADAKALVHALEGIQSVRTQRASSVNEPPQQDQTTKKMRLLSHTQ